MRYVNNIPYRVNMDRSVKFGNVTCIIKAGQKIIVVGKDSNGNVLFNRPDSCLEVPFKMRDLSGCTRIAV